MKPTSSVALSSRLALKHIAISLVLETHVLHRKHKHTVHRPGDDACHERDRCAGARFHGEGRVSTVHTECIR